MWGASPFIDPPSSFTLGPIVKYPLDASGKPERDKGSEVLDGQIVTSLLDSLLNDPVLTRQLEDLTRLHHEEDSLMQTYGLEYSRPFITRNAIWGYMYDAEDIVRSKIEEKLADSLPRQSWRFYDLQLSFPLPVALPLPLDSALRTHLTYHEESETNAEWQIDTCHTFDESTMQIHTQPRRFQKLKWRNSVNGQAGHRVFDLAATLCLCNTINSDPEIQALRDHADRLKTECQQAIDRFRRDTRSDTLRSERHKVGTAWEEARRTVEREAVKKLVETLGTQTTSHMPGGSDSWEWRPHLKALINSSGQPTMIETSSR